MRISKAASEMVPIISESWKRGENKKSVNSKHVREVTGAEIAASAACPKQMWLHRTPSNRVSQSDPVLWWVTQASPANRIGVLLGGAVPGCKPHGKASTPGGKESPESQPKH